MYVDADYVSKETDRHSISGVAVMLGGAAVNAESEYVAMAEGVKEGLFTRGVLSFIQPRLGGECIEVYEDNEGAKATAENPLSSGKSKHIDVRWHFLRDFVLSGDIRIVHVGSEWQHADVLTKALPVTLFKRHRAALMNLPDETQTCKSFCLFVCLSARRLRSCFRNAYVRMSG